MDSRILASGPKVGAVSAKTVWTPFRAIESDTLSERSALTTSMGSFVRAKPRDEEGSRVMARMVYSLDSSGSFKTYERTEPPCCPVAPKMARTLDIVREVRRATWKTTGGEAGKDNLVAIDRRLLRSKATRPKNDGEIESDERV